MDSEWKCGSVPYHFTWTTLYQFLLDTVRPAVRSASRIDVLTAVFPRYYSHWEPLHIIALGTQREENAAPLVIFALVWACMLDKHRALGS